MSYFAWPGAHCSRRLSPGVATARSRLKTVLNQGPPENSAARPLMCCFVPLPAYLAGLFGAGFDSMGQDGMRGAEHIVQAGGNVLAQDEASSVVWGMPRAVAEAGLARQILPLSLISGELIRNSDIGRRLAPSLARTI